MTDSRSMMLRFSRRELLYGFTGVISGALIPATTLAYCGDATTALNDDGLLRASSEDAAIDPRTVLDFIDATFSHELDLHSIMIYRHGHVVAEGWSWPYASHRPHIMHSLTKSVTACAVGLAVDEGHFTLSDPVVRFFDDELTLPVNDNAAAMTVEDLLTMRSGHAESVSGSVFRQIKTSWIEEFFRIPVPHKPGTHFVYSSAASFLLSAIVSRTTGQSARNFLEDRMFRPLGITGLDWSASPLGISSGGNGLTWKTVDSLKLGILHLNGGLWNGERILSTEWVRTATRVHATDGEYGYGYQWWVNPEAGAYYAEGAFGQFSIVFPNQDAVLAITAGAPIGPELERLIFRHFPAAFGACGQSLGAVTIQELRNRLDNLRLLPVARYTQSPITQRVSGKTYWLEPNEDSVTSIRLTFRNEALEFCVSDHRGDHLVLVGLRDWIESWTSMSGARLHHQYEPDTMKVVAHGRWLDDHTFEMTWQFVETAWVDHVVCRFFQNRISVDRRTNANYASRVAPTLRGAVPGGAPAK